MSSDPVLITGAAGFIGRHLCQTLLSAGRRVYGLDLKLPLANAHSHPHLLPEHWFQADICNPADWEQIPPVKTVFHLAALTGVRPSMQNAQAYFKCNIEGTAQVLDWCLKHRVENLIFASSSSVYGGSIGAPSQEQDPLRPASPYAVSKQAGENLIASYTRLNQLKAVALRFFTVYGPGQRPDMALYQFALALAERRPLILFEPDKTRRDMTYTSDLIGGMLKAETWLHMQSAGVFEVFNLGTGHSVSVSDWVSKLEFISGIQATQKQIQTRPAGDVQETWADLQHATHLLGYTPTTSLNQGLESFWNWFKQR
jgi:UDP-glucuronate 4-epimerase